MEKIILQDDELKKLEFVYENIVHPDNIKLETWLEKIKQFINFEPYTKKSLNGLKHLGK